MKTGATPSIRFLVLLPHRDAGGILRSYRRTLFAAGLAGAYSFPGAAPLAVVSRPFTAEELKTLARALREASLGEGRNGWIRAGEPGTVPFPACLPAYAGEPPLNLNLYGPLLDLSPLEAAGEKILSPFPRMILGAALVPGEPLPGPLPPPPAIAFRAAAAANMIYRPLSTGDRDFSFEWKIGKPAWLPPVKPPRPAGKP